MTKYFKFCLVFLIFAFCISHFAGLAGASDVPVTATVPDFSITAPILQTPANGTTVSVKRPTFSWQVSTSPFSISGYDFYLDGSLAAPDIDHTTGYLDSFFFTATKSGQLIYLTPIYNLGDTYHTWYVTATNSQGNTATSSTWEFLIDTSSPLITLDRLDSQILGWTTANPSSIPPEDQRNLVASRDNPVIYGQTEAYANLKIDLVCPPVVPTFCANITTTFITDSTNWSYQIPHLFTDTTYTVFIQSTDSAQNTNSLPPFTITLGQPTTPSPAPTSPPGPVAPPPPPKGAPKPLQNVVSQIFSTLVPPPLTSIIQNLTPISELVTNAATPIAAIGLLAQLFPFLGNLWYYLVHFVISALQYFGFWEKRQPLGLVYDAITKHPLLFATARLYSPDPTPRLLETDVTNKEGEFSFTVRPGSYLVHIVKPHYRFPSTLVTGDSDGTYIHIYHGELLKVGDEHQTINVSIPVDPDTPPTNPHFRFMQRLRQTIKPLSHISLGVGIIAATIAIIGGANLTVNVAIIFLYLSLSAAQVLLNRAGSSWGQVVNTDNQPVPGVPLHLIDTRFNRLVAIRNTNQYGRFQFTAPPGSYSINLGSPKFQIVSKRHFYSGETITTTGPKTTTLVPKIMVATNSNPQ